MNKIKIINASSFQEMRNAANMLKVEPKRPQSAFPGSGCSKPPPSQEDRLKKLIKEGVTVVSKKQIRMRTLQNFKTEWSENEEPLHQTKANFQFHISEHIPYQREGRYKHKRMATEYKDKESKEELYIPKTLRTAEKPKQKIKIEGGESCSDSYQAVQREISCILHDLQEEKVQYKTRKTQKLEEMSRMKFGKYWLKHKLAGKARKEPQPNATRQHLIGSLLSNNFCYQQCRHN